MNTDCWFGEFPKHVLEQMILPRFNIRDCIRFSAVGHSWRSLAIENRPHIDPLPWLMISVDKITQTATFLCLSDAKTYSLKLTKAAAQSRCCGYTNGYLIMANREGNFLFNPFSKTQISLPKQYVPRRDQIDGIHYYDNNFSDYFIKSIVAWVASTSVLSNYVVASICCNSRVFEMCRPCDVEWSVFTADPNEGNPLPVVEDEDEDGDGDGDNESSDGARGCVNINGSIDEKKGGDLVVMKSLSEDTLEFSDVLFYRGLFYGVTLMGGLVVFEIHDSTTPSTYRILHVRPLKISIDHCFVTNYLVDLCGELLMICRFRNAFEEENNIKYKTTRFLVFKLDESNDPFEWVEVKNLGSEILFLGRNSFISVSAKAGFQGNCIYFTEDTCYDFWIGKSQCFHDNGIFYLEDERLQPLSILDDHLPLNMQPIWVMPYIQEYPLH